MPDATVAALVIATLLTLVHVAIVCVDLRRDDVPAIEDSKAWTAPPPPPPSLDEAMTVVLERGTVLRRCLACKSQATVCEFAGFQWSGVEAWAHVNEECLDCGNRGQYVVPPQLWTCMEAMRTWESVRSAQALFKSETSAALDHGVDEA